jgi:molecular chaperone GrpE
MSQSIDETGRPGSEPDPEYVNPDQPMPEDQTAVNETNPTSGESAPPAQAEPSDDLDALRAQAAKAEQHWDLYLRTRAELDNYRRRATRERQDAVRFAGIGLIEKLLPVLDTFDMALNAVQGGAPATLESLQQGIAMVQSQFKAILTEAGVQEIESEGQPFDPNLHEAVAHHESAEVADGHVLKQLRKGYQIHERLVRPATVVVAKAPNA